MKRAATLEISYENMWGVATNNQFILGVDSNLPFTRWCCWKYTCQWGGRCMGCSRWQLCLHLVLLSFFMI